MKWERQISNNITSIGFDGIIAREKNIYTLYVPDFPADPEKAPHSLLILDRKGNPVVNCELPVQIKYFTIDKQEKYMYAILEESHGSSLVSFRLPQN